LKRKYLKSATPLLNKALDQRIKQYTKPLDASRPNSFTSTNQEQQPPPSHFVDAESGNNIAFLAISNREIGTWFGYTKVGQICAGKTLLRPYEGLKEGLKRTVLFRGSVIGGGTIRGLFAKERIKNV
jgi:hypothetical protein